MLTRDDLIDIIVAGLAKARPAAAARAWKPKGPEARPFLSEYDIKKRLTTGGDRLTIPENAIISPLVADWLTLRGIEVVRGLS